MSSTRHPRTSVVVLAGLLALVGISSVGTSRAGADESGFNLHLDPILLQPFFVDVDTNSAKWEEYRDVGQDMTIPELRAYGESADGNRTLDFVAEDVTRDDPRFTLNYGSSGAYSLMVDYNVIRHQFINGGTLPWSNRTAPNVFSIADPVQMQLQQAVADRRASGGSVNYDFLTALTKPYFDAADLIDVGLKRKRTDVRLDIAKLQNFSVGAEVKHEVRKGNRPYAGAFGFNNVLEIVEPIDYETTSLEVSGELNGERSGLRFGYRYSTFENEYLTVTYDNPFRVSDSTAGNAYLGPNSTDAGPSTGRNSLSPDNDASMFWVGGQSRLGDKGWVNGNLSYNVMKQDAALAPFSTNRAINAASGAPFDVTDLANLPRRNADTEARALHASLSAGTKLGDRAKFSAKYRVYDYDNKSTRFEVPGYVRMDGVWEDIGRTTVPYAYQRQVFEASLGFELAKGTDLSVGYTRDDWDRDFREVRNAHDDILSLHLDHRASGRLKLNGRYEYGKRSSGTYSTEAQEVTFLHPEGINNQPGLRKFDVAERTFNSGRVQAQIMVNDKTDLVLGFQATKDDYDKSLFGLAEDKIWQFNVEMNVNPTDDLGFFVYGNYADRTVFQRARQSGGSLSTRTIDDWEATFDEATNSWGAGLNARLNERWKLDVQTQWTDGDGEAAFFSPPGGSPDVGRGFDNYDDSELFFVKAKIGWDFNDKVTAGLGYWYENYTTSRFGIDGLSSYSPGAVLLAGNDGDYEANVFMLDLNLHF